MSNVAEHADKRIIHDFVIDPDHAQRRGESAEFLRNVRRLKDDGHYFCWVHGSACTKNLQVHHRVAEWMFAAIVDLDKVKLFCEEWDIYGYGRLLRHKPILTVDDIRNQMVLCQPVHTGVDHEDGGGGTGIHYLSFPSWIVQKICIDGANPLPQKGETFEQAAARIKEHEKRIRA